MISLKILIVTPHSDTAMRLLGWFAKHGMYVALEPDASKLRESVPAGNPDCILLDDAIGVNVLAPLVAHLRTKKAETLLLVSGAFSEEQEVALFRAGADDVLLKPLRTSALLFRISRLMKQST